MLLREPNGFDSAVQCGVHVSRLTGVINTHFLVKFSSKKLRVNETKAHYCSLGFFNYFYFFSYGPCGFSTYYWMQGDAASVGTCCVPR